ncbi:MAG TPA: NAD(P)/FAD-dependent oxidoreductase [Anaerolineaceae bacterium]|nr:NAD(P)/FAD-dependent oxidoreductase [Anaerolineaceae bacterium]
MRPGYDVVVVGAGPAGSVAARKAAEGGLSVLLLEKRQEIGSPVRCAEAIGADLSRQFLEPNPRWVDATITKFAIHNASGQCVSLPPAEPTLVVNRKVFDLQLALCAARAGAEVRASTAVVGLVLEDGAVKGVRVESFGRSEVISARLVVAADGTESQVGRWAGIRTVPTLSDYYLGIELFLAGMNGKMDPQICEYHLVHSFAPGGYLWVFPKGEDTANVGLVMPAEAARNENPLLNLERFVAKKYPGTGILSVISGGIPVTRALKKMVADGLVIVGDAAHQADPLTAGGINLAMIAADMAMNVAVPVVQSGDVRAQFLHPYEQMWQKRFGRMHEALYKIRKILSRLSQDRLDKLVKIASDLPLAEMSLGQIALSVFRNDPVLLLEARSLISTGLILK